MSILDRTDAFQDDASSRRDEPLKGQSPVSVYLIPDSQGSVLEFLRRVLFISPKDLAFKLLGIDRCFKKAHFASSNFRSKLGRFRESLEDLHPVLNKTPIERASDHDLDHLQATLIECRSIVRGCESFVDLFDALYRDRDAAEERQAGPPVWQDKELSKLRRDIDHRIDASLLRRLISVLYVTRRFPFFLCTFSLLGLTVL